MWNVRVPKNNFNVCLIQLSLKSKSNHALLRINFFNHFYGFDSWWIYFWNQKANKHRYRKGWSENIERNKIRSNVGHFFKYKIEQDNRYKSRNHGSDSAPFRIAFPKKGENNDWTKCCCNAGPTKNNDPKNLPVGRYIVHNHCNYQRGKGHYNGRNSGNFSKVLVFYTWTKYFLVKISRNGTGG